MNDKTYESYLKNCLSAENAVNTAFFREVAPKLLSEDGILFQREYNEALDRMGVDTLMVHDSRISYVDIKAHHGVYDKRRSNIALELETGYTQRPDKRYPGWFLSDSKITNAYAFLCWSGSKSEISDIRVSVIYRNDILKFLQSEGIDIFRWKDYLKSSPIELSRTRVWYIKDGVSISESFVLKERPFNLVIPWERLEPYFVVDRDFHLPSQELVTAAHHIA